MKALPAMEKLTGDTWADLATRAFVMGMMDAESLSKPIDSHALMAALPGYPARTGHRMKLRQIYGAGFDIQKLNRKLCNHYTTVKR